MTLSEVIEENNFPGWVTLTDLSRRFIRKGLLDNLTSRDNPETSEFLCQVCKSAIMRKIVDEKGDVLRWQCPNCGAVL